MSNSPRRDRERVALREGIVDAARRVLEDEGASALTIRRIAAEVEYKAPVVYEHFANKDALLIELVIQGFDLMLTDLRKAGDEPDVAERLLRAGTAYVCFARQHPHLYDIMNGAVIDGYARRRAAQPAINLLTELIGAWAEAHDVVLKDRDEACEIVWGTMAGMASLSTIESERVQQLAQQALGAILMGWRAMGCTDVIVGP